MTQNDALSDICCPRFEPALWDEKTLKWQDKLFIKDKVKCFFNMPLTYSHAMRRLDKKLRDNNATSPDWFCLSEHTSLWHMNLFLAVDKKMDGSITMSGDYYCKVYEGPYKDMGKWIKDFKLRAKEKNIDTQKLYFWYTTCPKCVKKYGKNYVLILAQTND